MAREHEEFLDLMSEAVDAYTELTGVKLAMDTIDTINKDLTSGPAKERRILIYMKMIEVFQEEIARLSGGEVNVEE